jgi:uncharacterized membrane protein YcaP (DUF421 family)
MGQMTVFDFVVVLLIANAVQNAMVGQDSSLVGGILAAAVLLVMDAVIGRLRLRSTLLRRAIEGSPTTLVLHGQKLPEQMRREGIDEEMLTAALHENGIASLNDVELAVLEVDGTISVVRTGDHVKRIRRPLRFSRRR